MVIQCKQCETTYNFDEALLANGSIDVRCVRCKNVFTVSAEAPLSEPVPQEQPELTTPAAPPAPPMEQQEEPSLPDWNSDEDSFSFNEDNAFSFEEESAEQAETSARIDEDEDSAKSSDSLPQEFSFASIDPEEESAPIPPFAASSDDGGTEAANSTEINSSNKKAAPPTGGKGKTPTSVWILLLIIMLIAGAYGYGYVTYGTTNVLQMINKVQQQLVPAPQQPQGAIRIDTSESYYVDNSTVGQLFIIQGYAVNNFPEPRSELKVIATLYKEKGIPLMSQSAYCGNVISKNELKTLPIQELLDTINNPFGAALSNVSLAPGQTLPFMIVFSVIPASLTEFSVEAESSKAASK